MSTVNLANAVPESQVQPQVEEARVISAAESPMAKKGRGQTGPRSFAGKNNSRWNALKHGATAKSPVLPFEDERIYKRHIREVEVSLSPSNYVESQLVREYGDTLWRIQRQENRSAYERDRILERLTPVMMAQMLGLSPEHCAAAPSYLVNLKAAIPKTQELLANAALEQYERLLENAKGIANFNLVWRQFPDLFNALSVWVDRQDAMTPLFGSSGKDLALAWQQHPEKIVQYLEILSRELFYLANFSYFKPQIRILMESWYFAQRNELQRLERDDGGLIAERKRANSLLDKLMQLRKSQYLLWAASPKEAPAQGFSPPKEIGFGKGS